MEQAIDNPDVFVGLEDPYVSLVGFQGECSSPTWEGGKCSSVAWGYVPAECLRSLGGTSPPA